MLDLYNNSDVTLKKGKVTIKAGFFGFLREIGNKILEIEDETKKNLITDSKNAFL